MDLSVFRDKTDAIVDGDARARDVDLFTKDANFALFKLGSAEDHLGQLCAPRADKPGQTYDFALTNLEGDITVSVAVNMIQLQRNFAETALAFGIYFFHLRPTIRAINS